MIWEAGLDLEYMTYKVSSFKDFDINHVITRLQRFFLFSHFKNIYPDESETNKRNLR